GLPIIAVCAFFLLAYQVSVSSGGLSTANVINALAVAGSDKPGHRVFRNTFAWPLPDRRRKGLLHGFLRQLKTAQQANKRSHYLPGLIPVYPGNRRVICWHRTLLCGSPACRSPG